MTERSGPWAWRAAWALLLVTSPVAAQASAEPGMEPLRLHRIERSGMDARALEAVWDSIASLPLVARTPVFGAPMSERTEIRVAYTDEMLYVRALLGDRDSSGIRGNSLYRDRLSGDDVLGLVIDPYDDYENGLWFWTTPMGVRGDAAILGDGRSTNEAWNAFWEASVTRSDSGWSAELRIPFATLGFPIAGDTVVIGLTVYRYIARRNEVHVFPAIPPAWDHLRPSRAQRVLLAGVAARRPLYVTPYVLAGVAHEMTSTGDTAPVRLTRDVGVDAQYRFTPALTLDLTLNTDFAQVEADEQQINLTRFPLFFPERRRFFQERSGVFSFATGGDGLLFHSRRIGLREGQPVRILGGARLTGHLGSWDVGFLQMQTAHVAGAPSENFGAVRVRRRTLNEQSYAGVLATSRVGTDGSLNLGTGVDAALRLFGDDHITVLAAHTVDRTTGGSLSAGPDAALGRVTWERRRSAGVRYIATAGWTGSRYSPRSGFVARTGVTDAAARFAWGYFTHGDGPLARVDPVQVTGAMTRRHADGAIESASLEYNLDLQWRSGAEVGADLEISCEDIREGFDLPGGMRVTAGRYCSTTLDLGLETPPGGLVRAEFDAAIGTFFGGRRSGLETRVSWNASRHVELAADHIFDAVRLPAPDDGFDSHVLRFRGRLALDTRASATAFVQYASLERRFAGNLRLRYNFAEGHDLWVVYDHLLDRAAEPRPERRAVLVKYTRTFAW